MNDKRRLARSSFGRIPAELRAVPNWVVWRWEPDPEKPGKRRKPPYRADDPGRLASSTKPETWGTFEQALALVAAGSADGVGFALIPPYVGVDLDEELSPNEQDMIMLALDSYAERSPSGTGHHVIVRASLNGTGRHPEGFGVWQESRFFYCTGEHVEITPATIEERQDELDAVLAEYLPNEKVTGNGAAAVVPTAPPEQLPAQLLARLAEEPRDRSRQSYRFVADCLAAGLGEGETLALAVRHRPTMEKYAGRAADEIQRTIEKLRAAPSALTRAPESLESVGVPTGAGMTTDSLTPPHRVSESESPPPSVRGTESAPELVAAAERPFALPVSEFVALERELAEPLLADSDGRPVVARYSFNLLGALGGHGKTTWFIDLALHLAAGVDYPPFTVPRPVSILLIENEGPEEMFAEKLKARLATFPHPLRARLDVCTLDWGSFSLADDRQRQRLTHEIVENGYELVFGDPLDSLGIEGVGSPEDTRKFLSLMKETGLHRTVAWWLNTHPRKEETKEALNEISGAWGGKPDTVLLLRMLDDDRTQIRFPKLRWARRGKRPTILLAFDPDSEAFTYLGEQSEDGRDYRAELLELLADRQWRTAKEISAPKADGGIGANVDTVKKILGSHPDLFESRTRQAAKEVGRSTQATVWQVRNQTVAAGGEHTEPRPATNRTDQPTSTTRRDSAA